MATVRLKIPVDREDNEITVTLDLEEVQKAANGQQAGACVVISRNAGSPLHARAALERVAA